MSYKTKIKIEQIIFGFICIVGFMCIGGFVGYLLGTIPKMMGKTLSIGEYLIMSGLMLALIYLLYYMNMCLHETGHMFFGLLTGYQFHSLRFGKLILIKRDGKLKLGIFNLPGTAGQCIMVPPETDAEHMPVVWYNLGGLIVNFVCFLLGGGLYLGLRNHSLIAGNIWLVFGLTAAILLVSNGLPFSQIGTDGANTIILKKSVNARRVFKNQLEILYLIANGYAVQEMPKELYEFDKSMPMDNPIVTSQAVNQYNYLSATEQYREAKAFARFILEHAVSINQIHVKLLHADLMFMAAVIDKDFEAAKQEFIAYSKEIKSMVGNISVQRALYAYYMLVEPDEKKAAVFAKHFENSVKHYPYPKEAAMEQKQFDMVALVLQEQQAKGE